MKVYPYWARGEATVDSGRRQWTLTAYGASHNSLEDAKRRAREIAVRAADAIASGRPPASYGYADRPLREEIVQQVHDDGELVGVITRNAAGSLVLNARRVMFVDVDDPPDQSRHGADAEGLAGLFKQWWGQLTGSAPKEPPVPNRAGRDDVLLERFEQVTNRHPGLGIRVYRTAGGFRLAVTSGTFDPAAAESERLLSDYGSDALYQRLCKAQESFRARLSAKFWRCGAARPPARFPWTDADQESRYRQWEQAYHRQANPYATCALVGSFGEPRMHSSVEPILELHDRLTIQDGAPLA